MTHAGEPLQAGGNTMSDAFPWVCLDGDHRYSAALSAEEAKAGGLIWDPRETSDEPSGVVQ